LTKNEINYIINHRSVWDDRNHKFWVVGNNGLKRSFQMKNKRVLFFGFALILLALGSGVVFADKDVTLRNGYYASGDSSLGMWSIIYIGPRSGDSVFVSLHTVASDGRGPSRGSAWEGQGEYIDGYKIRVRGTYMGTTLSFVLEVYSGTAIRYRGNMYRLMN
jgi:hypothetical protein